MSGQGPGRLAGFFFEATLGTLNGPITGLKGNFLSLLNSLVTMLDPSDSLVVYRVDPLLCTLVSSSCDFWKHPNAEGLIHMPISTTNFQKGSLWILWLHEAIARQLSRSLPLLGSGPHPGEFTAPTLLFPTQFPHSPIPPQIYIFVPDPQSETQEVLSA